MAKASCYEVPGAGTGSVALEEYVVEEASGEPVGKVVTVLERRGDLYVVVERGTPPLTHDLRAVPWDDIERVDHSALTVRLGLAKEAIEETLELDPKKGVKAEDAEAHRVTELPAELRPSTTPECERAEDDRVERTVNWPRRISSHTSRSLHRRFQSGLHVALRPPCDPGSPVSRLARERLPALPSAVRGRA